MPEDEGPPRSRPLIAPKRAGGTEVLDPGADPDGSTKGASKAKGKAEDRSSPSAREPDPARLAFARPADGTRVGPPGLLVRLRSLVGGLGHVPARELAAGGALTLVGVGLLLGWVIHVSWTPLVDLGLIVVGVLLVVQARRSTPSRPLIALGILLAVISAATWRADVTLDGGLGRRTFAPTTVAGAAETYQLGTGQLTLDLRELPASAEPIAVRAEVGLGRIVVRVPEDAVVTTRAVAGGGASFVLGERHGGPGLDELTLEPAEGATRTVVLDLHVGVGSVEVRRG